MFNGRSFWFITDAEDGCMTSAFQWLDHLGQRCALNISKKNVMTVGLWNCQLPAWNPLPWSRVASTLRSSPQQNCWKRTNIAVTWHMGKSFNSSATSSRAPWPSRGAPPSEQIDKLKQKMKVEKSSGPNHLHTFSHCCKKNTQICCLCQPDGTTRVPTNAGLDLYEARSH